MPVHEHKTVTWFEEGPRLLFYPEAEMSSFGFSAFEIRGVFKAEHERRRHCENFESRALYFLRIY